MSEQIAPYLQLGIDMPSLAQSTAEDRHNLLRPALDILSKSIVKDYGSSDSSWFSRMAAQLMDRVGLKKAQRKTISDAVVSGWATGPIIDSFTGAMALAGSIVRTPGRYGQPDGSNSASKHSYSSSTASSSSTSTTNSLENQKGNKGTGSGLAEVGETNEMIHPSVLYRMQKMPDYKPAALDGFTRSLRSDGAGYVWVNKKSNASIPEYAIHPGDSFTRFLAGQDITKSDSIGAAAFLGEIDRAVTALAP